MIQRIALFIGCFFSIFVYGDPSTILVTGGAGYIGSHTCKELRDQGYLPVVYDSLLSGNEDQVKWGPLELGDLEDSARLDEVFTKYAPVAVIHFAARKDISESIQDPAAYYETNVKGTMHLLQVMQKHKVKHFVFSSTAAVYGSVDGKVDENLKKNPLNPYAESKDMVESILEDFGNAYDFSYLSLRYFNAAGIDRESGLKRPLKGSHFLIPILLRSVVNPHETFTLNGDDYATRDGTPIRDFIHIKDLASAHVLALRHLIHGGSSMILNLGTGRGHTVGEVIDMAERVTGLKVPYTVGPRREGDISISIADPSRLNEVLHFVPLHSSLEEVLRSEWEAIAN